MILPVDGNWQKTSTLKISRSVSLSVLVRAINRSCLHIPDTHILITMRAYYFDNVPGDQRLPHDSGKPVDLEHLRKLRVRHWTVPQEPGYEAVIDRIAAEEGYKNRDTINCTKEGLGDQYETKLAAFFDE